VYGRGEPHAIAIAERDLRRAVTGEGGTHAIFDLVIAGDGSTHAVVLKAFQKDPLRDNVVHVDFHEVRLDRPIHTSVAVQLVGEPAGVREGGVLSQVNREVAIEAKPGDVPVNLELDVSGMAIGDTLRVADLGEVPGVTYLDDPDTVLANVTLPTRVVEPEEEVPEEGEEVPEEERPEGAAEAPAEPGAEAAGSPGTAEG
jgi:large subunit ribosomal protein L25